MFKAKRKDGTPVWIENAIIGEEYFCPICGKPLIIKAVKSDAIRTHFAHKKGKCLDGWHYDMSEWHRAWQEKFPEQCREVLVEKNGIKHRADVLINNTVIEFQHSPITSEEILARNEFYLSCGYRVVWVFDATDKIKNEYSDSIDPMKCRPSDLCWKRAKQQFSKKFQNGVTVYIQYKTTISTEQKEYNGKEFDILLLLKELTPKDFKFIPLKAYILQENFLQQYGINTGWSSIQQIINESYPQKNTQNYTIVRKPVGIRSPKIRLIPPIQRQSVYDIKKRTKYPRTRPTRL